MTSPPYRTRTVVVYFNVYNNGTGSQMWNAVDKVSHLYMPDVRSEIPSHVSEDEATPTPTEP